MSRDVKGKVKETVWNRSTCTDQSDRLGARRAARKDFKRDSLKEEGASTDVVAPDVFDEAFELA